MFGKQMGARRAVCGRLQGYGAAGAVHDRYCVTGARAGGNPDSIVAPVYTAIGADPSSFANTILAIDMGGYALAGEMAKDPQAGLFSWVFLGTMMGPAIVFTIPVALGIIEKEDHPYFAKGILIGLCTVPIGCFTGGLCAGFDIGMIGKNLLIPSLLSAVIAFGLWRYTDSMIQLFHLFGKAVSVVAIIGLAAVSVETLTGIVLIQEWRMSRLGYKRQDHRHCSGRGVSDDGFYYKNL